MSGSICQACRLRLTFSSLSLRPNARPFSSTTATRSNKSIANATKDFPPYPEGPKQWYKQADRGLYGGQSIRFGNNVGPKSKYKTRRTWQPTVINRRLQSDALKETLKIKMTTRVLRTIDKVGGVDNYVLGSSSARVKELGVEGWKLRCAIQDRLDHLTAKGVNGTTSTTDLSDFGVSAGAGSSAKPTRFDKAFALEKQKARRANATSFRHRPFNAVLQQADARPRLSKALHDRKLKGSSSNATQARSKDTTGKIARAQKYRAQEQTVGSAEPKIVSGTGLDYL